MESCRLVLSQGLNELKLSLQEDKINALLAFVDLISKWNKVYNLTAIKLPVISARLHLLDSLAINAYLQGSQILDVGTGAGLPGIPLAIINPQKQFVLLDSNAKKTRFVQQAVLELGLTNVEIAHCRIENYQSQNAFDCIITRAFASADKFIAACGRLLNDDGALLAMKGQPSAQELAAIDWPHRVYPLTIPGIDAERCLIKITKRVAYG